MASATEATGAILVCGEALNVGDQAYITEPIGAVPSCVAKYVDTAAKVYVAMEAMPAGQMVRVTEPAMEIWSETAGTAGTTQTICVAVVAQDKVVFNAVTNCFEKYADPTRAA
jgi:hypothetical protein